MRMRDRSSVERIRMALTEKRDMLGDMIAVERGCLVERRGGEKSRRKERGREERGGEGRRGDEKGEEEIRKETREVNGKNVRAFPQAKKVVKAERFEGWILNYIATL